MFSVANLSSTAVLVDETPTSMIIEVVMDPAEVAYWDAIVEVRRFWQAMRHEGPAPTDEGKLARLAELNTYTAKAKAAAEAIGRDFTAADFM